MFRFRRSRHRDGVRVRLVRFAATQEAMQVGRFSAALRVASKRVAQAVPLRRRLCREHVEVCLDAFRRGTSLSDVLGTFSVWCGADHAEMLKLLEDRPASHEAAKAALSIPNVGTDELLMRDLYVV